MQREVMRRPFRVNEHIPEVPEQARSKFHSRIEKIDGGCWLWRGARAPNGYGRFLVGGQTVPAHRLSYFLATGRPPGRMLVCHTCDDPLCVNPDHLFLGTHQENMMDRSAKGRTHRGSTIRQSKLTEADVFNIRCCFAAGISQGELGKLHGVKQYTIAEILSGKTWTHVEQPHFVGGQFSVYTVNRWPKPEPRHA